MEQKLKEYLFSKDAKVYAVLDGATVPDLLLKFDEMRPPYICLYRGELAPDLAEVAPYLIDLKIDTPFTNWVLKECRGRHWGIFAHSVYSITSIRKHFRSFLTVYDEAGNPMLFRYYDPRVLTKYLPTCDAAELKILFGRVNAYFAESEDASNLFRFRFADEKLQQQKLSLRLDETLPKLT